MNYYDEHTDLETRCQFKLIVATNFVYDTIK